MLRARSDALGPSRYRQALIRDVRSKAVPSRDVPRPSAQPAAQGRPRRPRNRSLASWVSTLKEENFRMRATPFFVALPVLSNDNAKAHARAPIAVLAGYAKS